MNLMRKSLLTFLLLGYIINTFSQENKETLKLSVAEAQTYALQNNRAVKSAKIDVNLARKKIWETITIGLPQLNLSTNYQHQFVVPKLSFGPYLDVNSLPDGVITKADILDAYKPSPPVSLGVPNTTTFDFTLSQLIFSGEYLVGLQATTVWKALSEKTLLKTEDLTKESVAGTYYLVLVLGENIRVLNESLTAIDQTYNDLTKLNQVGFNEQTDIDQIKITGSNLKTLIASLVSQREISIKLLKFQLGLDFTQPLILTDSLPAIMDGGIVQYLTTPDFNLESSVDSKIITNAVDVSELLVKREKMKYLPTVAAFYRRHEQTKAAAFNFQVKDLVGVSLNVPIFTSGQRISKLSQARYDLDKSRLNKETVGQGLIMEFESALSSYQTTYSNFTTNRESMELSKKVLDKTLIKFREGVSTSFELTQAQNQFLTTESNYYYSVLSLLNAKAKLDRILTVN